MPLGFLNAPLCCSTGFQIIPRAFRVFANLVNTPQPAAIALGIDPRLRPVEALQAWMKKRQALKVHHPVTVNDAAFLENYLSDPILLGSPPLKPQRHHCGLPFSGSGIWSNLDNSGVTDIVTRLVARSPLKQSTSSGTAGVQRSTRAETGASSRRTASTLGKV